MKVKKKNRVNTSTLKMLLVVEGAIILVLVSVGIGFILWNWGGLPLSATSNVEPISTPLPVITFTPSPSLTATIISVLTPTITITSVPTLELPPLPTLTLTALPTDTLPAPEAAGLSIQIVTPSPTQDLNFSLDSANTVPPDDVLHEVGYYGGAGGSAFCDSNRTNPYIVDADYMPGYKYELMETIGDLICNLPPNEDISETVSLPDQTTQQFILRGTDNGSLWYTYVPSLESPIGKYVFSFDVGSVHLVESAQVIQPPTTRLYIIGDRSEDVSEERKIILYNFLPNERIRLIAYGLQDFKIKFWQEYIANASGEVTINNGLEKMNYAYAAIGDISGVVYGRNKGWGFNDPGGSYWIYGNITYCPNPLNSSTDLSSGQYAEVIADSLSAFDDKDNFKENLPRGKVVQISGAVCKNHTWFVTLSNPDGEYIQEKDGAQVFLQPVDITATPQPTSTELSATNISTSADFSLSSMNTAILEDILQEITFYGGGGFGGIPYSACTKPDIYQDVSDEELMVQNTFVICGLSSAETLIGRVEYPDGRILENNVWLPSPAGDGSQTFYASFTFKPDIDDPEGIYRFSLEGKDRKMETNAYYRKPDGPRLFKLDNFHVLLTGFSPQEKVQLYLYIFENPVPLWWHFVGWQELTTDNNGRLIVHVSINQAENQFDNNTGSWNWPFTFVAIGERTGEVPLLHTPPFGTGGDPLMEESISKQKQNPTTYLQCSTALLSASHLQANSHATVLKSVIMYANPRNDARQVGIVPANVEINIVSGPYCKGNQIWWLANLPNKDSNSGLLEGYILEKDEQQYFAQP